MEETVYDLTSKIRQRNKSMTTTGKYEVEGSLNLRTSIDNSMYTLFYSDIYEFGGNMK